MELINTCYETTQAVRPLALYSHLLPAIIISLLGIFTYHFSDTKARSTAFLLFTLTLSLWLICDLILWHSNNYYAVAMFWSFLDFLNILFYFLLVLFLYLDYRKLNTIPAHAIIILLISIAIPFYYSVMGYAVNYFDETNCEMSVSELIINYKFIGGFSAMLVIAVLGLYHLVKNRSVIIERNRLILLTISSIVFLGVFSGSELIANLTDVYETTLYALFTLPVFILILTYSIFEQKTLNLKVSTYIFAKLLFLIFILVAIFSLFLADDLYEFLTIGASAIITSGFGFLLLYSSRKETLQREQIEALAINLEKANERLQFLDKQKSEFVSIASHQLRSPLTAIKGYAAMFLEGSYGELGPKMREPLERMFQSSKLMAMSIEDFLNVSRIESGNMKYEYSEFSIAEQASSIVDDLRQEAIKVGLILTYKSNISSQGIVRADIGKVQQILHNLINNSIKYTPKGNITVFVQEHIQKKKVYVEIIDTGIGMSQETIGELFAKFTRAKNANSVNIKGTGLGLFVAREMARAMGGEVSAHSDGEGKGSHFLLTFPLIK